MDINRIKISDGINFSFINKDKFKTNRISFVIFLPLDKKDVSKNALFPSLLERCCAKYSDFSSFNKKLDDLYGANIYSDVSKLGDIQIMSLSADCINDSFTLNNETLIADTVELLCDVIFEPSLENGLFKSEDFNQEVRQLVETIQAEYNDKRIYAKLRCEELMCNNEKFGINQYGTIDSVKNLTNEEVLNAWKQALESAHIEIIMVGNENSYESAIEIFKNKFSKIKRQKVIECKNDVIRSCKDVRCFNDTTNVSQCKMVMGFRTAIALPDADTTAVNVMSALFGGTPQSKLFLNVREKLSLCYYCSSSYNRRKGIIMVQSGVEKHNIEKAKQEILHQLREIQDGNFTQEELSQVKDYIIQAFRKIDDTPSSLTEWYISQTFLNEINTPEDEIKKIANVTKEKIIEVSKKMTLDTIYTLTGSEG